MSIILATWEVEIKRITVPAKSSGDPISINGWVQWYILSSLLQEWRSTNRRIMVQASLGIK
jgi:hypothetical protein